MKKFLFILYCCFVGFLTSCSNDSPDALGLREQPAEGRQAVNVMTRSEDGNAASSVQAGLFMVNYVDGAEQELLPTGNYVHNQMLTWQSGAWQTVTPIYWFDDATPADFYAYAPRQVEVADAHAMPFSIQADQRADASFAASDLLWGLLPGCAPTAESFDLTLKHVLSRLTVTVTAEQGFAEGELLPKDVSVAIGGTRTCGSVNLSTGDVSVLSASEAETVQCHSNGDLTYTAILLPQTVPFTNLIQVNWRGNKYTLQNSFRLEARRSYNLTVKLKKTQSGFDIGIEGWDIIDEDFGGSVGGE